MRLYRRVWLPNFSNFRNVGRFNGGCFRSAIRGSKATDTNRYAFRPAVDRFTLSNPRLLPSSSCFFRHFDLSGLSGEHQCWYRNSAAYLVDFAAPTARYPAKPVASAAGQTCHLKAREDHHFFALRHGQIRRSRGRPNSSRTRPAAWPNSSLSSA